MRDYYSLLKNKLNKINEEHKLELYKKRGITSNAKIKNIEDLQEKLLLFLEQDNKNTEEDYQSIIAEKIIDQYEEEKEDITFGVLLENAKDKLIVSLLIFDTDYTYSNLLRQDYDKEKIDKAKVYYMQLKDMIVNNDKDTLSKLIIEKL